MRSFDWSSDVCSADLALRDMGRLAVEIILERKTFPVKALLLIADALDGGAHRLFNLFQRARGPAGFVVVDALAPDFAGKDHPLCRGESFACNPGFGVFRQEKVHHRV